MTRTPHILIFTVIEPRTEFETIGEKLYLSRFGEYCPENSMRGYSLIHLLDYPQHYKATLIRIRGIKYEIPKNR